MKTISAIIVTFNRLDKLKVTLAHSLSEPFYYIVVINNASTDGTKEWLDTLTDNRLKVIHLDENIGGAGGFHVGFEYIYKSLQTDWLVCYDDDAYPKQGCIEKFLSLDLEENVASVAAAVYHPDGSISEMNRPRYNPFWHWKSFFSLLQHGKKGYYVSDGQYSAHKPIEIDMSTFVGYFLRTKRIKEFGLPREELFIYADDLIYTMQAHKFGYKHIFHPNISFIHDCDTFDSGIDVYKPIWKVYYTYRNRIEMLRVSSGILFYLFIPIQIYRWQKQAKSYPDNTLFLKLLHMAIEDGLRRNFSKKHDAILATASSSHRENSD